MFAFTFITTEVTIKKEAWAYPFISFVSEFGGALGLFLGVSILSFWDIIEMSAKSILLKINK